MDSGLRRNDERDHTDSLLGRIDIQDSQTT